MLKVSLNKLIKSPLIKEMLIIFILLLIGTAVFAQEGLNSRNLNENDLLIFYADPDNQDLTAAWENIAQAGLSQAAFWEEEEYNNELLDRLLDWSGTKLKEMLPLPDIFEFLQTIDEANLEHLFETDSEGNIIYDDKGDPILKKEEGFTIDKAAWDAILLDKIAEIVELWEQQANVVYEELLAKFSDNVKTAAENKLTISFNEYKNGAEREFANIFRQAENSFFFKRYKDSFSLKRKSDEESAEVIALELINETKDEISLGINRVVAGIETAGENLTVEGISVDPDEWLESFRIAFKNGLDKWDMAEEQLLTERIAWDKQTAIDYYEGEQAWTEAFKLLRNARENWEVEITNLIAEGQRQWEGKREELRLAIEQAEAEIDIAIEERKEGINFQIENLLEMYVQSTQMITTADNSIEFWVEEIERSSRYGYRSFVTISTGTTVTSSNESNLNTILGNYFDRPENEAFAELTSYLDAREIELRDRLADFNSRISEIPTLFSEMSVLAEEFKDLHYYSDLSRIGGTTVARVTTLYNELINIGMLVPNGDQKGSTTKTYPYYDDGDQRWTSLKMTYLKSSWYTEAMQNVYAQIAATNKNLDTFRTAREELVYWVEDVKRLYQSDQDYAVNNLARTYELAVGNLISEKDVLNDNVWETVALDEYQVELLIAQGELNYRQKQLDIAQAVSDYAENDTSSRLTDAETQAEYDDALELFATAEENYETAVSLLASFGDDLTISREALKQVREDINFARAELEEAQARYKRQMDALLLSGDSYFKDKILREYEELLAIYGLKDDDNIDSVAELRNDYFSALRKYGIESTVYGNSQELNNLMLGYVAGESVVPGLEELQENNNKLEDNLIWNDEITDIRALIEEAGIEIGDGYYEIIVNDFNQYKNNIDDALEAEDESDVNRYLNLAGYYKYKTIAYFETVISNSNMELENRIESIRLLISPSLDDWAAALIDFEDSGNVVESIEEQGEECFIDFIQTKTDFLIEGLELLVNVVDDDELDGFMREQAERPAESINDSTTPGIYAYMFAVYHEEAASHNAEDWIVSLNLIADLLEEIKEQEETDFVSNKDLIKALTNEDELAYQFFNNGFNILNNDLDELFLKDDVTVRTRAVQRNVLIQRYAGLVRELKYANQEEALEELTIWLFEAGLAMSESTEEIILKDPDSIWGELADNDNADIRGVENYITELKTGFYELAPGLPQYVNEYISNYIGNLSNLLGIEAFKNESNADFSDWNNTRKNELQAQLDALELEIDSIYTRIDELEDTFGPEANNISFMYTIYLAFENEFESVDTIEDEDLKTALSFTQNDIKEELVKTAGLKLALYADTNNTTDWENIYNILEFDYIEGSVRDEIYEYTENVYNLSLRLEDASDMESGFDYDANDGMIYRAVLWNSADPVMFYDAGGAVADLYNTYNDNTDLSGLSEMELYGLRISLSGMDFELISGLKADEAEVYERAVYSGAVNSLLGTNPKLEKEEIVEVLSWMFELYGLNMLSDTFYDDIDGLETDSIILKCFEASVYGTDYYLRRLAVLGEDITAYDGVYNLDNAIELESELDVVNSYLGITDGSALEYAIFDSEDILSTFTGAGSGLIENDVFVNGTMYLGWKNSIEQSNTAAYIELFKILANKEIKEMSEKATDLGTTYEITMYNKDIVNDWIFSLDVNGVKRGFSYRSFLTANILELEEDSEADQLTSTLIGGLEKDNVLEDGTYNYYYYGSTNSNKGYNNRLLDIYNDVLLEGDALIESINFMKDESADAESDFSEFYSLTSNIFDFTGEELETELTAILNDTFYYDTELTAADSKLRGILSRIDTIKSGLAVAGENLILMNSNTEQQKNEMLEQTKVEITGLEQSFADMQILYYDALDAFELSRIAYDTSQMNVRNSLDEYNEERYNLQITEEIIEYAESVYINEKYNENQTVTPADKLAYAQYEYDKAFGIFNILDGLYGENENNQNLFERDGELNTLFTNYEQKYKDYLILEHALGILQESVSAQKETVQEWEENEWESLSKIFSLNFPGENETSHNLDFNADRGNEYPGDGFLNMEEWARRFILPGNNENGFGLIELNMDNYSRLIRNDGISENSLHDYFDDEERFGADVRDFVYKLGEMAVNNYSGFNDMFERWDSAYLNLMARIKCDNGNVSGFSIRPSGSGSGIPTLNSDLGSYYNLSGSYKRMIDIFNYDYKDYSISNKIFEGGPALATINSNPEEQALFNMFLFTQKTKTFDNANVWNEYTTTRTARFLWWKKKRYTKHKEIRPGYFASYFWTQNKLNSEQAILDTMLGAGENNITSSGVAAAIDAAVTKIDSLNGQGQRFTVSNTVRNYYYNTVAGEIDLTGNVSDILAAMRTKASEEKDFFFAQINANLQNLNREHEENMDAYDDALANIDTATEEELDSALAGLDAVAGDALKTPVYSQKDISVRFYELYQEIVNESIGNINCDNLVYDDLSEIMRKQQEQLNTLYANRLDAYKEIQSKDWDQLIEELQNREDNWFTSINAVLENGRQEWSDALMRMNNERKRWAEQFEDEYEDKSEMWNVKYLVFLENKNAWVNKAENLIITDSAKTQMDVLGLDPDIDIGKSMTGLISDISIKADPISIVNEITENEIFFRILDFGRAANNSIRSVGTKLYSGLAGSSLVDSSILTKVFEFQTRNRDEIERHSGILAAAAARKTIDEVIAQMLENVQKSNKSVETNMANSLTSAGFNRSGDNFSRSSIVSSSIFGGDKFKTQTLTGFGHYVPPEFDPGVNLEDSFLMSLSPEGINCIIDKAMRNLSDRMEDIFGEPDEDDNAANDDTPLTVADLDGTFNIHVGIAPELKDEPDPNKSIGSNLETPGHGELKRVYTKFFEHELAKAKGEAESNAPFWRKPLFGNILKGFSLSSVVDIAMNIVSKAVPILAIPGINQAFNMIDDFTFGMMNIATGMDAGDVFKGLGKKALGSFATMGIGQAFGSVTKGIGESVTSSFGGVIGKTLGAGVQGFMGNAVSGLVNGMIDGHMRDFEETVIGRQALAGYASGMSGTFVTAGLGAINMKDAANMTDIQKDRRSSFNSTMGNLASMGVEYGMTGKTTINVLNFGNLARRFGWDWFQKAERNDDGGWDRTGEWQSQGLLELHLGKSRDDNYFQFGGAGFDFSLGTIARSFGGLRDWYDSVHPRSEFAAEEVYRMQDVEFEEDIISEIEKRKSSFENYKKNEAERENKKLDKSISAFEEQGLDEEEYFNGYNEALDSTFTNLLGTEGTEGELDALLDYLENNGGTDEQIAAIEQFQDELQRLKDNGIDIDQHLTDKLLPYFQDVLTELKESGLDADDSLVLITNVMRGTEWDIDEGGNGLARVLAYNHLADGKGDDSYGYAINDVALLLADDTYVEMVYDTKSGGYSRILFKSGVNEVSYGDNVTYDSSSDNDVDYDDPHFDCGAFPDYVYYAAGITNSTLFVDPDDQNRDGIDMPIYLAAQNNYVEDRTNETFLEQFLNGNLSEITQAQIDEFRDEYDDLYEDSYEGEGGLYAILDYVTYINADDEEVGVPHYGLLKMYFNDDFSTVNEPRVGSLVFFEDNDFDPWYDYHVGIYGVNDSGQNVLIHSAPATTIGGIDYSSGARTNILATFDENNDGNDSYINWLIDAGYTTTFGIHFSDMYIYNNFMLNFFNNF